MKERRKLRPLLVKLVALPILMFGFGYLMVPLYDVFCDLTGLNGKTGSMTNQEANQLVINKERSIKVQFVASVNQNGPWEFEPTEVTMMAHPGQTYNTAYFAKNKLDKEMTSQSVPSVSPQEASTYFKKTECFCFTEQKFKASEGREMPLTFVIDPELPEDVDTIILSYTLFTKT